MKKILCAALSAVICLSLCACQGTTERYPEIADMLDRGDYEGAIDKIRDMGGITESSKETAGGQSEVTSSEAVSSEESSVVADVSSSEESSSAESTAETSSASTAKHGKVTITLDNWDEYFEFVVEEQWQENAFGEAEVLHFVYKFQPKEEYADKIKKNANFSVAVEYTFTTTTSLAYVPITVDYENRTYSLGDIPSETMTGKRTFKYTGLAEYVGELGRALDGNTLYGYCWDFDVTRVEGAIYLK